MRRSAASLVRISIALAAGGALLALPSVARAVDLPPSINAPPQGAGTERVTPRGRVLGFREGISADAAMGSGFTDTYGLGIEGRIGYTFRNGIYAGGNVQYFAGHSINDQSAHAAFVGGELGYKFYPSDHVEIRPYAFVGPAFVTEVSAPPLLVTSKTGLAVQPGVIATYHFGNAYIGGDAHYMVTPTPNTLAILATAGLGF